jgi:hypothetical protein
MIQEFPISLECELEDEVHIDPEGKARLMILKVRKVWADEAWNDAGGRICPTSTDGNSLVFFSHSHGSNGGVLRLWQVPRQVRRGLEGLSLGRLILALFPAAGITAAYILFWRSLL